MKTLDEMLSSSMADMAVRNDAMFESTRKQVLSTMGGGGVPWTWITSVSVLVIAGATWYALQTSNVETVSVKPVDAQVEDNSTQPSLSRGPETVVSVPMTKHDSEVRQNTNALNAQVESIDPEIKQLFDTEMKKADAAIQNGDRQLAKKIYRDLARTMRLNGDEQRARTADAKALAQDKK